MLFLPEDTELLYIYNHSAIIRVTVLKRSQIHLDRQLTSSASSEQRWGVSANAIALLVGNRVEGGNLWGRCEVRMAFSKGQHRLEPVRRVHHKLL